MNDEILRWLVLYDAIGLGLFTIILAVRTYRRVGLPCLPRIHRTRIRRIPYPVWPLHVRWIITFFVASWAGRVGDLALARNFGMPLNPPHTVFWWFLLAVMMTWLMILVATGNLVLTGKNKDRL